MYREAWTALGFGRPMRLDSEDCDVEFPNLQDVLGPETDSLPEEGRNLLTDGMLDAVKVWIGLLKLSLHLEYVLKSFYRPRSLPPSALQIQQIEADVLALDQPLHNIDPRLSSCAHLHVMHMKSYIK